MRFDKLGTRMKSFESVTTGTKLLLPLPLIARIDGRAFHTFTRGMNKPFDLTLVETMQEVCKYLVDETNAKLGYVQSDEISLCWFEPKLAPFDGKLFKLQSVLASMATSKFICYISDKAIKTGWSNTKFEDVNYIYEKCLKLIPSFDCRVFQVPNMNELANYFVWREIDAVRNSVSVLAQSHFSPKQLHGKDRQAMLTMLEEKGVRWNELSNNLKRGTYYQKENYEIELDDETWNKIPENKKPESRMVIRSRVIEKDFPIMKNIENKVGVYFFKEEAKEKEDDNTK